MIFISETPDLTFARHEPTKKMIASIQRKIKSANKQP